MKYYILRGGMYVDDYCIEYVESKYIFKNKKIAENVCNFVKDVLKNKASIGAVDYIIEQYFKGIPKDEIAEDLDQNFIVYDEDEYEELFVRISEVCIYNENLMETE